MSIGSLLTEVDIPETHVVVQSKRQDMLKIDSHSVSQVERAVFWDECVNTVGASHTNLYRQENDRNEK